MSIINNLYNIALTLFWGCIITTLVSGVYIIGIIRYTKKDRILIKELDQMGINNIDYK